MKKTIFLFFLIMMNNCFADTIKHVILISIDGLRPDFYRDSSWAASNLRQLSRQGVSSEGVKSVFPSDTYPAHSTIVTGVSPAKHQVYYNSPFESDKKTGRWYWEAKHIKAETLWDAIQKAGLTSAAINWPVSTGGPIHYNLPEIWSLDKQVGNIQPIRENATPKGLLEEVEKHATGKLKSEDMDRANFATMDSNIAKIASYIIKTYEPSLTMIHLIGTDYAQHQQGRQGEMVKQAVASADQAVEKIVDTIKQAGMEQNTALIIVGDHGFLDLHTQILPNIWLTEGKLIDENNPIQWKAKFHSSPGAAAFLHLKTPNDEETLKQVISLLKKLPASKRKLFRIANRSELAQIGTDPNVALALIPAPGVTVNDSLQGADIQPMHGGGHGNFPDQKEIETGFIAYGPSFKQGVVIPEMNLKDIAPLVAKLLNIRLENADGQIYPDMFIE